MVFVWFRIDFLIISEKIFKTWSERLFFEYKTAVLIDFSAINCQNSNVYYLQLSFCKVFSSIIRQILTKNSEKEQKTAQNCQKIGKFENKSNKPFDCLAALNFSSILMIKHSKFSPICFFDHMSIFDFYILNGSWDICI